MRIGNDNDDRLIALTNQGAATVNGEKVETGEFASLVAYLNVTAVGGTPSLAMKLQDSPDGVEWYDVPNGAFAAATAVGKQRLVVSNIGDFVRAVATVSGTTPTVSGTVDVVGVR